jgi:hypothetical protein
MRRVFLLTPLNTLPGSDCLRDVSALSLKPATGSARKIVFPHSHTAGDCYMRSIQRFVCNPQSPRDANWVRDQHRCRACHAAAIDLVLSFPIASAAGLRLSCWSRFARRATPPSSAPGVVSRCAGTAADRRELHPAASEQADAAFRAVNPSAPVVRHDSTAGTEESRPKAFVRLCARVLTSVTSPHSKRNYARAYAEVGKYLPAAGQPVTRETFWSIESIFWSGAFHFDYQRSALGIRRLVEDAPRIVDSAASLTHVPTIRQQGTSLGLGGETAGDAGSRAADQQPRSRHTGPFARQRSAPSRDGIEVGQACETPLGNWSVWAVVEKCAQAIGIRDFGPEKCAGRAPSFVGKEAENSNGLDSC